MGFKKDDGTLEDRCLDKLLPGEPFFVLRARDLQAVPAIRYWFQFAKASLTTEHADEAVAQINSMLVWQFTHNDILKNPD